MKFYNRTGIINEKLSYVYTKNEANGHEKNKL